MTTPYAFISYRRSDSAPTARALHFQLRLRFGSRQVFMDVGHISPGDVWPARLRRALDKATLVFAVIGPNWLTTADEFGRRRLDAPHDWVHQELSLALKGGKTIIPLRVGGVAAMMPPQALPKPLRDLPDCQDFELRDRHWDQDMQHLIDLMVRERGFVEMTEAVVMPEKGAETVKLAALTEKELDLALRNLPRWEPAESMTLRTYPHMFVELRRVYRFNSFKQAIRFISEIAVPLGKMEHHPRLENQWRTVIVHFSTWDIGNRITRLDIEAAHAVDRVFEQLGGT